MAIARFSRSGHRRSLSMMLAAMIAFAPLAGFLAALCMSTPDAMAAPQRMVHQSMQMEHAKPCHGDMAPIHKLACVGACSQLPASLQTVEAPVAFEITRPVYVAAAMKTLVGYRAPPDLQPPRL
ncbi:hypothetical protein [Rhizobium sp. NRK18]|uniref:hypothetical protein n=1 Tax=Rhizobium sp. NRK18 TaxID=2964667 RepID=UPI0021C40DB4|nr:hypothetical protein [Rhizobium sp. NRK18]MCQ2004831.1 hypothetical protein [Rhizobium sp. NRK18]